MSAMYDNTACSVEWLGRNQIGLGIVCYVSYKMYIGGGEQLFQLFLRGSVIEIGR